MSTSIRAAAASATAAVLATMALAGCASHHAAAAAAPTRLTASKPAVTTLAFVAQDEPGNMTLEDLGRKSAPGGPDLGDLLAFTQTLTVSGKPVGKAHVFAVGVDHKLHLSEATGTISLSDGTIQIGGLVSMSPKFTLVVTGGTGAYAGDAGTVDFSASASTQHLTVHLTGQADR